MELEHALASIAALKHPGTLATLHPDGRPHLSVVFAVVVNARLWISATQTRVKTRNIRHDPRVTFSVGTRPWVAVEGTARIIGEDGVPIEDLRRYYRLARGEHPDWEEYDRAMRDERRLIIEIEPARAYGFGSRAG